MSNPSGLKSWVAQKDEMCAKCEAEIPRGASCLMSEEELICEDCNEERGARFEVDKDFFTNLEI